MTTKTKPMPSHILPRPVQPGKASFAKDAKVVITAETKVTICPPWKPRYEAIPLPGSLSVQKGRVSADIGQPAPARASESEATHD